MGEPSEGRGVPEWHKALQGVRWRIHQALKGLSVEDRGHLVDHLLDDLVEREGELVEGDDEEEPPPPGGGKRGV